MPQIPPKIPSTQVSPKRIEGGAPAQQATAAVPSAEPPPAATAVEAGLVMDKPKGALGREIGAAPAFSAEHGGAPAGRTAGLRLAAQGRSSSGVPHFLERPKVEHLKQHDGSPNTTWANMTAGEGVAWDVRMQGRPIDEDLLYELARYERDPLDAAARVAELAGMGIIHGRAFEQVTNNTNFKSWKAPLEERTALALAVKLHSQEPQQPSAGGQSTTQRGDDTLNAFFHRALGQPNPFASPLRELWETMGSPGGSFDAWKAPLIDAARDLLKSAGDRTLLQSPAFAEILRAQLGEANGSQPAGTASFGASGLRAYQLATQAGAPHAHALDVGQRAEKGEIDVATLAMLAPDGDRVSLSARRGRSAFAAPVPFEARVEIAGDVAAGKLTSGQIYGFFQKFGAADESMVPRLDLRESVEIIKAVNRGEIELARLEKVLDPSTFFPDTFVAHVWETMFSKRYSDSGNKYTISGAAPASLVTGPFTRRLTCELVTKLAQRPASSDVLASSFRQAVEDNLPGMFKRMGLEREHGRERWEARLFDGIVEDAMQLARQKALI